MADGEPLPYDGTISSPRLCAQGGEIQSGRPIAGGAVIDGPIRSAPAAPAVRGPDYQCRSIARAHQVGSILVLALHLIRAARSGLFIDLVLDAGRHSAGTA